MSLNDRLKGLAEKAKRVLPSLETEEATKNALVMPFLAALGYDVFDPAEVVPEFNADYGLKKGEKVDYAIKKADTIIMLVEAKKIGADLSIANAGQLFRYFSVTKARIAILTNGRVFRFFSDLDEPNKMDESPFLEMDLLDLKEDRVLEVAKMAKDTFDLDHLLNTARELKHLNAVRQVLDRQFDDPDEDFVRFFFKKAGPRDAMFLPKQRDQFTQLVKRALAQTVSDRLNSRLRSVIEGETSASNSAFPAAATSAPLFSPPENAQPTESLESNERDGIVTTAEELDGFQIIRAIGCSEVPYGRINYRDAKSYFAILFDDNNRKPICRLHFNREQKYIGLMDEQKNETRVALESLPDIYKHAEAIRATIKRYASEVGGS